MVLWFDGRLPPSVLAARLAAPIGNCNNLSLPMWRGSKVKGPSAAMGELNLVSTVFTDRLQQILQQGRFSCFWGWRRMKRAALNTIIHNIWIRIGVLAVMVVAAGFFMLPEEIRMAIWLKAAYFLGFPVLGSLGLGLATLWLSFRWKPTLWVAGITFVLLMLLVIVGSRMTSSLYHNDNRSAATSDKPASMVNAAKDPFTYIPSAPAQQPNPAAPKARNSDDGDPLAAYSQ